MDAGWGTVVGLGAGLLVAGIAALAALLVAVARTPGRRAGLREVLGLLPACLVLARRLHADRSLPTSVRWLLRGLVLYLVSPIDLVPDVVPVLGWADDAVVTLIVLRRVLRRAGPDAVDRHWPGDPDGLAVLLRLAGQPVPTGQTGTLDSPPVSPSASDSATGTVHPTRSPRRPRDR